MTLWTREEMAAAGSRHDRETEFERRRRQQRMDERAARARLYRIESGTVHQFPARAPVTLPPKDAA